ncbi:hypothetical protein THAOC_19010 [Thalassiosira oceanica]|uniref:Uncharacterized protein n=1 Tax=Thalassiosira oceanica TaxID=159749 RepID=K0S3E5_THAOC|nr:hypothetical protein THAOC_19010 [Thalassiosira oceanica]|eukprot:EJK60603.1 hypothetical protein THAOC_19010 [Thalassiosira oceanica]
MAGAEARRFDIPAVIGVRCDAGRGFRPKAATPGRSTATTAHDAMQVVALSFTTNLECAFLLAFEPLPSTLEKPTLDCDGRGADPVARSKPGDAPNRRFILVPQLAKRQRHEGVSEDPSARRDLHLAPKRQGDPTGLKVPSEDNIGNQRRMYADRKPLVRRLTSGTA